MKLELKENMYVRTKDGYIARLNKINKTDRYTEYEFDNKISYDYDGFFHSIVEDCIDDIEIIKTSHNIIDLIEVGDYINGVQVIDKEIDNLNEKYLQCGVGDYVICTYNSNEIEDVVTKEQFSAMEYRLGDDK